MSPPLVLSLSRRGHPCSLRELPQPPNSMLAACRLCCRTQPSQSAPKQPLTLQASTCSCSEGPSVPALPWTECRAWLPPPAPLPRRCSLLPLLVVGCALGGTCCTHPALLSTRSAFPPDGRAAVDMEAETQTSAATIDQLPDALLGRIFALIGRKRSGQGIAEPDG